VEEAGEVAGAEGLRNVGEAQGDSSGSEPDLGRDRKHAGDAEADFCLLDGRQSLAQSAVGERDRFLAVAGDVQSDRRRPDDLPAARMVDRRDLDRALTELSGGNGIGRDERLCSIEQRGDRHLITYLGASGELHGDFDRQRASFEQDNGGLAVECAPGGDRDAGADGLASEVVPERQFFAALDEQARLEELPDRRQQVRRRPPERARQLVERKRTTERGGDGHGLARLVGEPAEPLPHLLVQTPGQPAVDQLCAAVDNADPLLLLESEERLDDEERTAVGLGQLLQDRLIGLRGEHVRRQLDDRIVGEWAEDNHVSPPLASAARARARAASPHAAVEARSPRRSAIPSVASAACGAPPRFRRLPSGSRRSKSGAATPELRAPAIAVGRAATRIAARAAREVSKARRDRAAARLRRTALRAVPQARPWSRSDRLRCGRL
jgi:hypothetical protein